MTTELDNDTLEWAAEWIEGSLKGEANERVREFGRNMAMTLRAAKVPRVSASVAPVVDGISWSALLSVLERLRSKNRNPDNEWYHGWNAAIQCLINDVNARAAAPASTVAPVEQSEPWSDEGGHVWERHPNVECVECPHCCFTFAAVHTDGYSKGYSCPNCEGCPDAASPADIRDEAEGRLCMKCGHEERHSDNEGGTCEKIVDAEANFCGCVCRFAGCPIEPRICAKCGHDDETDLRGRCISVSYDAGGSLVYCGCKCEFNPATPPSTRAKAAAQEIGAWIFMLEQPLTSETDLRVATDHVESIILKRCFAEGEDTK